MEIRRYKPEYKVAWDEFVTISKNGTFLLHRNFMEYHADRFTDNSYLLYNNGQLIALLPANRSGNTVYSHQGLTYGGLVMSARTKAVDTLSVFDLLLDTLRKEGVEQLVYKPIPHIYHQQPSEEDLYALFRNKAVLSARNISSTLLLSNSLPYSELRMRGIKKAKEWGLKISLNESLSDFWAILSANLQSKYNRLPVHSFNEINCLKNLFPENILFAGVKNASGKLESGCIVFETQTVTHIQYIAASDEGKKNGAVDLLVDHIIGTSQKKYFDYGISTEQNGCYLNENLVQQKEGFGARATVYDTYIVHL